MVVKCEVGFLQPGNWKHFHKRLQAGDRQRSLDPRTLNTSFLIELFDNYDFKSTNPIGVQTTGGVVVDE